MTKAKIKRTKFLYSVLILVFVLFPFFQVVEAALNYGSGYYTNLCGSGTAAGFYSCPGNCNPSTGECSGNYVVKWTCDGKTVDCRQNESNWTNYQKVDSPHPGCGKTVQIDVFKKNCREGGPYTWSCNDIPCGQAGSDCIGYMTWYSGDCPPSPSPTPTCPTCNNLSVNGFNTNNSGTGCSRFITLEPNTTVPISVSGSDPDGVKDVSIYVANKFSDRTNRENWTRIGGGGQVQNLLLAQKTQVI